MCFDGRKPEADALMRAAREALEARGATPEKCPACSSRKIIHRTDDKALWACRNCGLMWTLPEPEPVADPTPPEDRGTPVWVWRDADGWYSFWRLPRGVECCEVSAPIGWRLRPDHADGVVLANVFGDRLTAVAVMHHAERGEGGFRVRGREATG